MEEGGLAQGHVESLDQASSHPITPHAGLCLHRNLGLCIIYGQMLGLLYTKLHRFKEPRGRRWWGHWQAKGVLENYELGCPGIGKPIQSLLMCVQIYLFSLGF